MKITPRMAGEQFFFSKEDDCLPRGNSLACSHCSGAGFGWIQLISLHQPTNYFQLGVENYLFQAATTNATYRLNFYLSNENKKPN